MEEQTTNENWMKEELEQLNEHKEDYERLDSLKLEEGKITSFTVIADKPFDKWTDQLTGVVKKIIPVLHNEEPKNFWLNVKNPLYAQILTEVIGGKRDFSVFQTGSGKETKYTLVKD